MSLEMLIHGSRSPVYGYTAMPSDASISLTLSRFLGGAEVPYTLVEHTLGQIPLHMYIVADHDPLTSVIIALWNTG